MLVAGTKEGEGGQVTLMNIQNVPIVKLLQTGAAHSAQQQQQRPVVRAWFWRLIQDGIIMKYLQIPALSQH
jgi:hypothetical protein